MTSKVIRVGPEDQSSFQLFTDVTALTLLKKTLNLIMPVCGLLFVASYLAVGYITRQYARLDYTD